jgi:hypothetical protein
MAHDKSVKQMRQTRRDILKLIQINIEKTVDFVTFNNEFLPTLNGLVEDFQNSHQDARDPEVLYLFATLMRFQGSNLAEYVEKILYHLCYNTLEMV